MDSNRLQLRKCRLHPSLRQYLPILSLLAPRGVERRLTANDTVSTRDWGIRGVVESNGEE